MALSDYQGPKQNHTGVFKSLVGDTIQKAFVDFQGHVWLVMTNGCALKFAGFNTADAAFEVVDSSTTQQEIDKHKAALQARILELRGLAPGIDL